MIENIEAYWKVVFVSLLPISELRGGIPLAAHLGLPMWKAYLAAVIGNLLPVIPLLLSLNKLSEVFSRTRMGDRFFAWLFKRTRRRAAMIEKYEAIGLMLFVAIPLPTTGAWTGCVAAVLFRIRFKYALPAIIGGVLIAGIVVSLLTYGGKSLLIQ
ncbi:MAG: small multi-drug export protein [Caldiserica bacterium]|nr:small multi-drug export protein [Caldisericota bacterium]